MINRLAAFLIFAVFGPLVGGLVMVVAWSKSLMSGAINAHDAVAGFVMGAVAFVPLSYFNGLVPAIVTGLVGALTCRSRNGSQWILLMAGIGALAAALLQLNSLIDILMPNVQALPSSGLGGLILHGAAGAVAAGSCAWLAGRLARRDRETT